MVKIVEYEEVNDNIVKFEKKGDSAEGIYLSKEEGHMYGNEVYKLKADDGRNLTIFSTSVLSSLMASVQIGDRIKIVFQGTKDNNKKGQNAIKLFKVFVAK